MKLPTAKLQRYPASVSGAIRPRSRSGVIISETGLIIVVMNELGPRHECPLQRVKFSRDVVSFLRLVVYILVVYVRSWILGTDFWGKSDRFSRSPREEIENTVGGTFSLFFFFFRNRIRKVQLDWTSHEG